MDLTTYLRARDAAARLSDQLFRLSSEAALVNEDHEADLLALARMASHIQADMQSHAELAVKLQGMGVYIT